MTLPTDPAALVSQLRVDGLKVTLTHAGTVAIKPKARITDEVRAAIAAVGVEAIADVLRQERRPVEREPGDTRPKRPGRVGDLKDDAAAAWAIIRAANDPPTLFRSAGLAWIENDDEGHPGVVRLDAGRIAHYLAQTILFTIERPIGDALAEVPVPPPAALVRELAATPDPPAPVLARIVTAPIVTRAGTIHDRPGYDLVSRSFYAPPPGFTVPAILARPTPDQIAAAVAALIEVIEDFPLVGDADRAHTLAALLTMFARDLVDGPVPLVLLTKPAPGTGASLLCNALILIANGRRAAAATAPAVEEEWGKVLTALLMAAPVAVFFDNLSGTLGSAKFLAALTADIWEDRALGRNDMVKLPVSAVWLATGNNVALSNELSRRTVRVALDARVERPWLRARDGLVTFRHPDLLGWISQERPRLVHAALTLISAWVAAGRPAGSETMGTYECWARVLGGILDVAGVPGFLSNIETFYSDSDVEMDDIKRLLSAWWEEYQDNRRVAADLFTLACREDVALPLAGRDDHARRCALGRYLDRHRGRPYSLNGSATTVTVTKDRGEHRPRWFLAPGSNDHARESRDLRESLLSSRARTENPITQETVQILRGEGRAGVETPAAPATPAGQAEWL